MMEESDQEVFHVNKGALGVLCLGQGEKESPGGPVRMPLPQSPSSKTARERGSQSPASYLSSPWVWRLGERALGMALQEPDGGSRWKRRVE